MFGEQDPNPLVISNISHVTRGEVFQEIKISPIPLNLTLRPLTQSLSKLLTAIINSWAVVESSAISASVGACSRAALGLTIWDLGWWVKFGLGCGIAININIVHVSIVSVSECYNSIWVRSLVSDRILCRVDNNLFPRSERRYLIPAWVSKIIIIVFTFMKLESTLCKLLFHIETFIHTYILFPQFDFAKCFSYSHISINPSIAASVLYSYEKMKWKLFSVWLFLTQQTEDWPQDRV